MNKWLNQIFLILLFMVAAFVLIKDIVVTRSFDEHDTRIFMEIGDQQSVYTTQQSTHVQASSCKPQKNVAFLKVHKTGSSTMLNMFYRYADRYHLNLVLPKSAEGNFNYLGYGTTLNSSYLVPLPRGETYNILCNHVVYNRQAFHYVMPRDTLYIGILRNPLSNFISAFAYYGGGEFMQSQVKGVQLTEVNLMKAFLQNPHKYNSSGIVYYLNNKMSFDFGLEKRKFYNTDAISEFISELDRDFILVIILEYLDECLVLLKRMLCWKLQDIIYLPVNVRYSRLAHQSRTAKFGAKLKKNLQQYNIADFMLYDFFKKRLLSQIQDMNRDFKSEVKYFQQVLSKVSIFCRTLVKENLTVPRSEWNSEFNVTRLDCLTMTRDELNLVKEKIIQANQKYSSGLKSKG